MKVSVLMITYNHEEFIAQALESALAQNTDFDYEIVIGEDHSTDNTQSILVDYQTSSPNKILLSLNETNLGMIKNFYKTLQLCQGEYIALLEGDDYWVDPYKLTKQVNFMDSHPECSLCFTNANNIYTDLSRPPGLYCTPYQKRFPSLDDLLENDFIPTCTAFYRNNNLSIPGWLPDVFVGDIPLFVLLAELGNIGYIPDITATYRKHEAGVMSTLTAYQKIDGIIDLYIHLFNHFKFNHRAAIQKGIANYLFLFLRPLIHQANSYDEIVKTETNVLQKMNNLPEKLKLNSRQTGKVFSPLFIERGFIALRNYDGGLAKRCFRRAIYYDVTWLQNRGVLATLIKGTKNS